jgi:hypothetical protein
MTGILGEYIGRIYEQVKLRPIYVVAELVNFADQAANDSPEVGSSAGSASAPDSPRANLRVQT